MILDLEDAVLVSEKDSARQLVSSWLDQHLGRTEAGVVVRVNPPRTKWCHQDLHACAIDRDGPLTVVVPKVESAADIGFVDRLLSGLEACSGRTDAIQIHALVETAEGMGHLSDIAGSSRRLTALVIGYADLGASLGRSPFAPAELWAPAQDAVITAARSHGLAAIDGPHLNVEADEGFVAAVVRARAMGFDGKWVVHPRQISTVAEQFQPSEAEIGRARAVLEALDQAEQKGAGTVALDGQMLDEAVAVAARRTLDQAGVDR